MGRYALEPSYWTEYFRPEGDPARPGHSTGWIAARMYRILAEHGTVDYWTALGACRSSNAGPPGDRWNFRLLFRRGRYPRLQQRLDDLLRLRLVRPCSAIGC